MLCGMMDGGELTCWLLSEPKAGMAVQCLALAEAMGLQGERKHVQPRGLWKRSPIWLWPLWGGGLKAVGPGSDAIGPPWPDVVISCGRYAAGVAMAIRQQSRHSGKRTFTIQIQDPLVSPRHFDLMIVPEHDRLRGENVITMQGSLHRITDARLQAEAAKFASSFEHLPRPLATVLIGGPNRVYQLGVAEATAIAQQLVAMAQQQRVSLAMTVSRRTSPEAAAAMRKIIETADIPAVIWEGEGENPYFGYLGSADYILVTADSINMTCEASATGKPVYTLDLPGGRGKFARFHQQMQHEGRTRLFEGKLEPYEPNPLRENEKIAAEVWRRLPPTISPPTGSTTT
ncbi:MAG: mitochondrial fission ELM1 family protein [Phycisphaeraceae bacterium]